MAKRVNTRFLIIITTVAACLIAGAFGAHFAFFRKDPKEQAAIRALLDRGPGG